MTYGPSVVCRGIKRGHIFEDGVVLNPASSSQSRQQPHIKVAYALSCRLEGHKSPLLYHSISRMANLEAEKVFLAPSKNLFSATSLSQCNDLTKVQWSMFYKKANCRRHSMGYILNTLWTWVVHGGSRSSAKKLA